MFITIFIIALAGLFFSRAFDCNMKTLSLGTAVAALMWPSIASADETLVAADNSKVECRASRGDMTRISLISDSIASVSKMGTGNEYDDFTVVKEPLRGDIYISVASGFLAPNISFFLTSKKGFVYKFVCALEDMEAQQVFISNPALATAEEKGLASGNTLKERAVRLIQAMAGDALPDGYEVRQPVRSPVNVGSLKVRLLSEYRGNELSGKVLWIKNKSDKPLLLDQKIIAPGSALAVSIAKPNLEPGGITTAYLVGEVGR